MSSLYQTETWTDKDGNVFRLKDMDARYCAGLLMFLERNARALMWNEYQHADADVVLHDGGDMAHAALERIADELLDGFLEGAWDEWLAELPFVIALKKALKKKRKKLNKAFKKELVR